MSNSNDDTRNRNDESKHLLLVDISSYFYRAFHAMPDLRSPEGFPTGAIHGMVAMMKKLREHCSMCVTSKPKTCTV